MPTANPMTPTRQPEFWTCNQDEESLTHTTIADAVLEAWDNLDPDDPRGGTMPETITVYGYAPMVVRIELYAQRASARLLDDLDEEYGDPDGPTDETEAMREAARAFVASVLKDYRVWGCEQVCEETVNTREYIHGD